MDGFPYCRIGEFIRFYICSIKVGTLPSYAASTASDPESRDSTVVLFLNFGGILKQKSGSTMEYAQLQIKNKKMCGFSQRCVPPGFPKIFFGRFSSGIHQNIQKARKLVNARACQEIIVFPN